MQDVVVKRRRVAFNRYRFFFTFLVEPILSMVCWFSQHSLIFYWKVRGCKNFIRSFIFDFSLLSFFYSFYFILFYFYFFGWIDTVNDIMVSLLYLFFINGKWYFIRVFTRTRKLLLGNTTFKSKGRLTSFLYAANTICRVIYGLLYMLLWALGLAIWVSLLLFIFSTNKKWNIGSRCKKFSRDFILERKMHWEE